VSGLTPDASGLFAGVRVGAVTTIALDRHLNQRRQRTMGRQPAEIGAGLHRAEFREPASIHVPAAHRSGRDPVLSRANLPEAKLWPDGIEDQSHVISRMLFAAAALHPARPRGMDYAKASLPSPNAGWPNGNGPWGLTRSRTSISLGRSGGSTRRCSLSPRNSRIFSPIMSMLARAAVRRTIEVESAIGYKLPA
jgi:hypothetical protein